MHPPLLALRLEFSNFHRGRRLTVSKLARACVAYSDDQAAREKREEDRTERKRIQASREKAIKQSPPRYPPVRPSSLRRCRLCSPNAVFFSIRRVCFIRSAAYFISGWLLAYV